MINGCEAARKMRTGRKRNENVPMHFFSALARFLLSELSGLLWDSFDLTGHFPCKKKGTPF